MKQFATLLVLSLILGFFVVSIPEINVTKAEYSDLTPPEKVLWDARGACRSSRLNSRGVEKWSDARRAKS